MTGYEDYEEKEPPSEDIAELHFRRIQAIPVLSDAEEQDLLQRWCEFKDEKAREQIILAHMRMVPPIARDAAFKAGFQPNYNMMAGTCQVDRRTRLRRGYLGPHGCRQSRLDAGCRRVSARPERQILQLRSNVRQARDLEAGHIPPQRSQTKGRQ